MRHHLHLRALYLEIRRAQGGEEDRAERTFLGEAQRRSTGDVASDRFFPGAALVCRPEKKLIPVQRRAEITRHARHL